MNDNIKELIERAGFDIGELTKPYPGGFPKEDLLVLESLVKQTVTDCLEQNTIVMQQFKDNPEDIPGWNTIMNLVNLSCANQIKEHFGIE